MTEQHIPNPDGKIAPRSFWLVTGRALQSGTTKPVGVALTFDNKDLAIRCYKGWNLVAGMTNVKIKKSDVNWEEFVPTTKADLDLWDKVSKKDD